MGLFRDSSRFRSAFGNAAVWRRDYCEEYADSDIVGGRSDDQLPRLTSLHFPFLHVALVLLRSALLLANAVLLGFITVVWALFLS